VAAAPAATKSAPQPREIAGNVNHAARSSNEITAQHPQLRREVDAFLAIVCHRLSSAPLAGAPPRQTACVLAKSAAILGQAPADFTDI